MLYFIDNESFVMNVQLIFYFYSIAACINLKLNCMLLFQGILYQCIISWLPSKKEFNTGGGKILKILGVLKTK